MMLPPAHGPDQPDDPTVCDLGYRLLRRCWRQGLASEASRVVAAARLRHGRPEPGHRADHGGQRRLPRGDGGLGMRYVRTYLPPGTTRCRDPSMGEVEYEMTREMWQSRASTRAPRRGWETFWVSVFDPSVIARDRAVRSGRGTAGAGRRRRSPGTAGPPRPGGRRPGPADRPGSRPSPARPAATPRPVTPVGACRRRSGAVGQYLLETPQPAGRQGALLVVDHQHLPLSAAPEQDGLGQRRQHRLQRWRDRPVVVGSAGSATAHTRVRLSPSRTASAGAPSPSRASASRAWKNRSTRPAVRLMPPLGPDQLDEGREEDTPVATGRAPGPVQGEGGRTVVPGSGGYRPRTTARPGTGRRSG